MKLVPVSIIVAFVLAGCATPQAAVYQKPPQRIVVVKKPLSLLQTTKLSKPAWYDRFRNAISKGN